MLRGCTFAGNEGLLYGGTIVYLFNNPTVENCTIVDNIGVGVVIVGDSGEILGSNIAFNHGAAVTGSPSGTITLTCCNLFGNEGGDWTGAIAGQLGMRGNINLDPLFCGLETRDFGLQSGSPCGPEYNPKCGLIGAWPVGCAGAPARTTTWGALKSLFREPSK